MKLMNGFHGAVFALLVGALGCGENLAPPFGGVFAPPKDLKALSIDSSTVRLEWTPPDGALDSRFDGYQIDYLGKTETVSRTVQAWDAKGLPPGLVNFSIRSRTTEGRTGDPVTIAWAGAKRFENNYTLIEFFAGQTTRVSGLDVGHALRDPMTMSLVDVNAGQLVDIFLAGGGLLPPGQEAPLRLYSASIYAPAYPVALFSGVIHSSASLDYPLASYPGSIDSLSVPVYDNSIYYVLIGGPNTTRYAARLHVHLLGGSYPNRSIAINVSLQKAPNVLFAEALSDRSAVFALSAPLALVFP
jgi:hypothetical protein